MCPYRRFRMQYKEATTQFLYYLRHVKNSSEHTIRNYGMDLEAFGKYFEKMIPAPEGVLVAQIDKRAIRGYLADLSAKAGAKRTVLKIRSRPSAENAV